MGRRRRGEGGRRLFHQIDAGGGGDRGRGCHSRCAGPSPPPPPPPPASSPWSTAASTAARPALPLPCGRKLHSIRRKWSQHAFRGQRGAMDTDAADGAADCRTAQTRETDERSRPNQVRPGVRPSPVRSRRPFVWRSYEQRGRGGGRGADAASAVTTAMVTVWNAALLPPRLASLPLRPSMDNHPLCCVFAAIANKKNGTA